MSADLIASTDPRLSMACAPLGRVNRQHRAIALRLAEAMEAAKGIGIAAPQIGEMVRICVVVRDWKPGLVPISLFDPLIVAWSKEEGDVTEGCLSFPGESAIVRRRQTVLVQHKTPGGATVETPFSGIEAACVQHEIDHLNGITMHMRALIREIGPRLVMTAANEASKARAHSAAVHSQILSPEKERV